MCTLPYDCYDLTMSRCRPLKSSFGLVCIGLGLAAALTGCATLPRPVPAGGQPVATVESGGVVLSVPRLEPEAYPDDILEVATAVYVAIENRGQTEVQIAPEDFTLGPPNGMGHTPLPAQQILLSERRTAPVPTVPMPAGRPSLFDESAPVLAGAVFGGARVWRPPVMYAQRYVPPPAPAFRSGGPVYRGGIYLGGAGPRYYGGPRFYGGIGIYAGPRYYWGGPYWWATPGPFYPYWWGPGYYVRSRDEAVRYALPAGRLPPGGRTAGFLYFPKRAEAANLLLRWQVRDANTRIVIADMRVPMDLIVD
jgi:hypothetical protein